MAANVRTTASDPSRKKQFQLRIIGSLILLVGLAIAGWVYWLGTHSAQLSEEDLLPGNSRAESRQMEILYGKMGLLTQKISSALKRPATQAILIASVSLVMALACFHVARLIHEDCETEK